ncbi:MAG: hypothetical protein LBR33_09440 [Propionibacteriaceae bacterium]|nr:hypothetical protein [Propionibacteriaceae bacterium]
MDRDVERAAETGMGIEEFESSYYALLMCAWTSDDFAEALLADPLPGLRGVGLAVPDGVSVEVIRDAGGNGDLELAYRDWIEGVASGHVRIVVPDVPPVEPEEITPSALAGVTGGTGIACCCPCCSCCP